MDEVRAVVQAPIDEPTGKGVRIAVLDTGVDGLHPDLLGCVNRAQSRTFCLALYERLFDPNGHGTHVAGIIAGSGEASEGRYRGIAPSAELIVLRVLDSSGTGVDSDVAKAIVHALDVGVDIINYSAGARPLEIAGVPPWKWSRKLSTRDRAFQLAADRGVLCVAAAGNEGHMARPEDLPGGGSVIRPGNLADILCVGATQPPHNVVTPSSGRGPVYLDDRLPVKAVVAANWRSDDVRIPVDPPENCTKPDVVAPGKVRLHGVEAEARTGVMYQGIVSARSRDGHFGGLDPTDPAALYARCEGTSQATAVVTGLAALLLQYGRDRGYSFGSNQGHALRQILRHAARPLEAGDANDFGYGLPTWSTIRQTLEACSSNEVYRRTVMAGPQLKLMI